MFCLQVEGRMVAAGKGRGEGGGGSGGSRSSDKRGVIQSLRKRLGGGEQFQKNFSALVWSKNKGGGGVPGPLPWIRHLEDFITGSSQWLTDRQQ